MNAAAMRLLQAKGLTLDDCIEVAEALERKKDNTAAERQARYRAKRKDGKSRRNSNGVTPPIEYNHTPSVSPIGEPQSGVAAKRDEFPKPEWCDDDQVWADFLKNRKRKRLPNTVSAHKGFLDDINRIADDEWPPGRLLRHAAAKGWGGIYDPRQAGKPNHDKPTPCNDELQNPYVRVAARRAAERAAARAG